MKKLSSTQEKKLLENFSLDELIRIENNDNLEFDTRVISIYNHFLTEKEAENAIFSYPTLDLNNRKIMEQYFNIEEKYLNFFKELFIKYDIIIFNTESTIPFYFFEKDVDFLNSCKNSLREKEFINIYIIDLNLILVGSFDLNNVIYYKKALDFTNLENILKKYDLFLI